MTPRKGSPRPIVGIRIKPDAITLIDRLAEEAGVTRSEMCRRLLGEALAARQKAGRLDVPTPLSLTFAPITEDDVKAFRAMTAQFAETFTRILDAGSFDEVVKQYRKPKP